MNWSSLVKEDKKSRIYFQRIRYSTISFLNCVHESKKGGAIKIRVFCLQITLVGDSIYYNYRWRNNWYVCLLNSWCPGQDDLVFMAACTA